MALGGQLKQEKKEQVKKQRPDRQEPSCLPSTSLFFVFIHRQFHFKVWSTFLWVRNWPFWASVYLFANISLRQSDWLKDGIWDSSGPMRFKAKTGAGTTGEEKHYFCRGCWVGKKWAWSCQGHPGYLARRPKLTQREALRQQEWKRVTVPRFELLDAAVPEATFGLSSFMRQWIPHFVKAYFQLSFSHWKASRLPLEG